MPAPKGNKFAKGNPGGGRPTKYKAEFVVWAEKLARLGATDQDVADAFEVSLSAVEAWKRNQEEFSNALKRGKVFADAEVADKLFQRAIGYSHPAVKIVADAKTGVHHIVDYTEHYPPDAVAAIFWLKNRQREKWRDRVDVDAKVDAPQGVLVAGPVMSPEEWAKAAAKQQADLQKGA